MLISKFGEHSYPFWHEPSFEQDSSFFWNSTFERRKLEVKPSNGKEGKEGEEFEGKEQESYTTTEADAGFAAERLAVEGLTKRQLIGRFTSADVLWTDFDVPSMCAGDGHQKQCYR